MPTPVGHAVAGLATAWFAESAGRPSRWITPLAMTCAAAAVFPDVDLLVDSHRTYTHSVAAVALVGLIAWLSLRRRTPLALRVALTIAIAYGSHILLDWLGKDTSTPAGVTALWPFSSRFYVSGLNVFGEVSRRYWRMDEFVNGNFRVMVRELLILGPVAALAWWLRSVTSEQ